MPARVLRVIMVLRWDISTQVLYTARFSMKSVLARPEKRSYWVSNACEQGISVMDISMKSLWSSFFLDSLAQILYSWSAKILRWCFGPYSIASLLKVFWLTYIRMRILLSVHTSVHPLLPNFQKAISVTRLQIFLTCSSPIWTWFGFVEVTMDAIPIAALCWGLGGDAVSPMAPWVIRLNWKGPMEEAAAWMAHNMDCIPKSASSAQSEQHAAVSHTNDMKSSLPLSNSALHLIATFVKLTIELR